MPTELDTALNTIMDGLSAPGQPFETSAYEATRFAGDTVSLPAFANAPPSLAHFFAHFCKEHANVDFLVDGDTQLTFGECWQAATHVAAGLAQNHGVKKGDRIGIAARNSANWIIAYMGTIMAGGCVTLLNGFWTGNELAYGVRLAECTLVLADSERSQRLEDTDHTAKVIVFDHDLPPSDGLAPIWGEGDTAMQMLGQLGSDDLATILYTSGSTGQSKGAYSDHRGVMQGTFSYIAQSAMAKVLLDSRGEGYVVAALCADRGAAVPCDR